MQFIYADLGDAKAVNKIFAENAFDAVMHFASVAYVGESTTEPLRYTWNVHFQKFILLNLLFASSHCLKLFFIEVQFFFVIFRSIHVSARSCL